MFNFSSSVFKRPQDIPEDCQIVFVADLFVEDYVGGAELTSEALIETSPYKVYKLHSKDVTLEALKRGQNKLWIFGNFSQLNQQLIATIVANMQYVVLEYDYKYCTHRSPEKHALASGQKCNCENEYSGKLVSAFFHGAKALFWMSEAQMKRYHDKFPFLSEQDNHVISSIFSSKTLLQLRNLRNTIKQEERSGWIVLGSNSWVKGFDAAKNWCESNSLPYETIFGLSYEETLAKLASAEGFVYLPAGADTCPRMVIEAKLLNCKLHINDNVQHSKEEWFATDDLNSIEEYLSASPTFFWNKIKSINDYQPTISGYTTTFNCIKQKYPFKQCIQSMLQFCDEVCVVDGGSIDGTWEKLRELQESLVSPSKRLMLFDSDESRLAYFNKESKMKLKQVVRDWAYKHASVFDGMQKAEARKMCTSEFCWQMDSDEIVHEDDAQKIKDLVKHVSKDVKIISLPVIEYWGSVDKVRIDVTPWKWRLSRNEKNITHGIPANLRRFDEEGNLYAAPGTDGCDMIDSQTFLPLQHMTFYTLEADQARQNALLGSSQALAQYQTWYNQVVNSLPSVFHYSWLDIARKIRLYRDYWQNHWRNLENRDVSDTAANNMFFDLPWSEVTEQMIEDRAKELSTIGGWVWHRKWNGTKTPWITVNRTQPNVMNFKVGVTK